MKKLMIITAIAATMLSGCAIKQEHPICKAVYIMGGTEYTTPVFSIKKDNGQTMYKAGHPFNFRYVNKSNFTSSTCDQS